MQVLSPQSITARKPQHDPAYKVHLRLTADLKWFDITDADLRDWVRELHPDAYRRYRSNVNAVIAKLETLRDLMDEAASRWKNLPPRIRRSRARSFHTEISELARSPARADEEENSEDICRRCNPAGVFA